MNNRKIGTDYEDKAVSWLINRGYQLIARNFHAGKYGEIDIIAKQDNTLVFVEVKYRASTAKGDPKEAVNLKKEQRISRVADYFLLKYPQWQNCEFRFDVIAILNDKIEHIENAFWYHSR